MCRTVKNRKVVVICLIFPATGTPAASQFYINIPFLVNDVTIKQALLNDAKDGSFYYLETDLTRDRLITFIQDTPTDSTSPFNMIPVTHQLDKEIRGYFNFIIQAPSIDNTGAITTSTYVTQNNNASLNLMLEFVEYETDN